MDFERGSTGNKSDKSVFSTQLKRWIALLAITSFIIVEVCYIITHIYSETHYSADVHFNTNKFSCDKTVDISNTLQVNICNKLVNIFKTLNNTVKYVSFNETELFTLAQLLR